MTKKKIMSSCCFHNGMNCMKKDNNSPNAVSKWMNQCILIKVTHTVGVTACDFFFHYFPAALSDGLTFQTRLPLPGSGHTLCSFSSPRCQSHCEPRLQPAASDSRMCLEVYLTFLFDIYVPPRWCTQDRGSVFQQTSELSWCQWSAVCPTVAVKTCQEMYEHPVHLWSSVWSRPRTDTKLFFFRHMKITFVVFVVLYNTHFSRLSLQTFESFSKSQYFYLKCVQGPQWSCDQARGYGPMWGGLELKWGHLVID